MLTQIGLNTQKDALAGKRREWIYPKLIIGQLYKYRSRASYFLLILLFAWPFIKINGEPYFLFNILERKFIFFGVLFMPQDFYLFVLAMLTFIVFIILFTAIFGRVWCGWACPQTIFMEMVFRKIEYWIEGSASDQRKLNESPLTRDKLIKKSAKHLIFILISFFIANIFLAYIIGSDELFKIIIEPVNMHVYGFISIWIFTGVFYIVFTKIRELVCTVICPYGRLQGVLIDRKTLVVAYDYLRGEPRGHIKKKSAEPKGDCTDCGLCVDVCPTGIDIRKGTQLECINCTACIDACDMVMEKIGQPLKLIGFKSEDQISEKKEFRFGKRVYAYAAILLILMTTLTSLIIERSDIAINVFRAGGTLYQLNGDSTVTNLYNAELINKTTKDIRFNLQTSDPETRIRFITVPDLVITRGENVKLTFFIIKPQRTITAFKSSVAFDIISGGKIISSAKTTFIAPPNK